MNGQENPEPFTKEMFRKFVQRSLIYPKVKLVNSRWTKFVFI